MSEPMIHQPSQTPDSDRAREAWESIPGDSEASVEIPAFRIGDLPPTLMVSMDVHLPDGRSYHYEESAEYERDEDGQPKYFQFEDTLDVIDSVTKTMTIRFE